MRRIPSLLSLPDPLYPWLVAPDGVLSLSQIELFDVKTMYLC